jgi:hypothetical protein
MVMFTVQYYVCIYIFIYLIDIKCMSSIQYYVLFLYDIDIVNTIRLSIFNEIIHAWYTHTLQASRVLYLPFSTHCLLLEK